MISALLTVFTCFICDLLAVQALCEANPDIHLKKAYDSQLSSAQRLERRPSPLSSPVPSFAEASTRLLSVEKGPCEYCHQLIPLSDIIHHEVLVHDYQANRVSLMCHTPL